MNVELLRSFCISKKAVTESFPFNEDVLVFKVMNKMFCLISLEEADRMNVKCDPELAMQLREKYPCVLPGYHMNKNLWNTVVFDGSVPDSQLLEWVEHSYDLVVASLPRKDRRLFDEMSAMENRPVPKSSRAGSTSGSPRSA